MEVKIQNRTVADLNFPDRKLRTTSEKNWNASTEKTVYLEEQDIYLNGKDGEVYIKCKVPKYTQSTLHNSQNGIAGTYLGDIPEDIAELLRQSERLKYRGKTSDEMTFEELIEHGILL